MLTMMANDSPRPDTGPRAIAFDPRTPVLRPRGYAGIGEHPIRGSRLFIFNADQIRLFPLRFRRLETQSAAECRPSRGLE